MIKKIRYRLVWNRSGCLNQRGEGLVQIEAEQQHRKIYFSTPTYVLPEQFQNGCIVNASNADGLNYALFSMIREVEDVELDYIRKGVEVTLPLLWQLFPNVFSWQLFPNVLNEQLFPKVLPGQLFPNVLF